MERFPARAVFFFLFNDILLNGSSTRVFGSLPPQVDSVHIPIHNLWESRFTRSTCCLYYLLRLFRNKKHYSIFISDLISYFFPLLIFKDYTSRDLRVFNISNIIKSIYTIVNTIIFLYFYCYFYSC